MRLDETPLLGNVEPGLKVALTRVLKNIAIKVNQLGGGYISGNDNTNIAAPSTGSWFLGDYVKKSNPVQAGAPGAKYVIKGWIRVTSGSGNALNTDWLEDRALTGN